jgi:uncharacterized repeat protein (TIGR03847 family)
VIYEFSAPDKIMVGTRGPVGERLFLLQVREGQRLVIVKCEKQQLAALATWIAAVLDALGRPEHLPEDLTLEAEYAPDLTAGEITVGLDADRQVLELVIAGADEETEDTLTVTLTREWAAALAIAVTRLVEAGRPPCPLCGYPLDPAGHDCPRTNGHVAPRR